MKKIKAKTAFPTFFIDVNMCITACIRYLGLGIKKLGQNVSDQ
jgi:hypothetical protein